MDTQHSLKRGSRALAQHFAASAYGFSRERDFSATVLVEFGSVPLWVGIVKGRVAWVDGAPMPLTSWDFAVRARPEIWERFWQAVPQPGSHDIFALAKQGDMRIEGNLYPLMCHLQYMKDLLAIGRGGTDAEPG